MFKCPTCGEKIDHVRAVCHAQASYTWHPDKGTKLEAFGPTVLEQGSEGDPYEYVCPECGTELPEAFVDRMTLPEFVYTYAVSIRTRDEARAESVRNHIVSLIKDVDDVQMIMLDGDDIDNYGL